MSSAILGVDPGKDGGLALIDGDRVEVLAMPRAGKDIDWPAVSRWIFEMTPDHATVYLEQVRSMPKQGVASMFSFGVSVGGILGVAAGLNLPLELVLPRKWQGTILAGMPRDRENVKASAKAYAARRWPHLDLRASERARTPHSGICDALCIAEFGRRQTVV